MIMLMNIIKIKLLCHNGMKAARDRSWGYSLRQDQIATDTQFRKSVLLQL